MKTIHSHDHSYAAVLRQMQAHFDTAAGGGAEPLFTTDAQGLWEAYLDEFDSPEERQHHNCSACRRFIQTFGSLVTIEPDGTTTPVMWQVDGSPTTYFPAIAAMKRLVRRAKVTGVFLSPERVWGTPDAGGWSHFAVKAPKNPWRRAASAAGQAMAEKLEDYRTIQRALAEFKPEVVKQALNLLKAERLYRSEKVLGPAQWLHDLHAARAQAKRDLRNNVVWRAVAVAPPGFCHPRSSVVGTLLEDIAAGLDFAEVSRKFKEKMNPTKYQRPKAAPTDGAIAAAEKLVADLGIAASLARRFARLDEVQALWRPRAAKASKDGSVFGHLRSDPSTKPFLPIDLPQTMTWEKFERTVLRSADRIEFLTPRVGPYAALVTAVSPDAPPILQWDREDARNPVSWYLWRGGALARTFGLEPDKFAEVEAIALQPSMWNGGHEHQGKGVMFLLAGARETRDAGLALFPEILKAELHGVRAVLEAYSAKGTIEGMSEPHAAGVMFSAGVATWPATLLRVWSDGGYSLYRLDRWD